MNKRRLNKKSLPTIIGTWNGKELPKRFTAHPYCFSSPLINNSIYITPVLEELYFDDRPIFISLFSGAGGDSLGFINAGWRCVASVEIADWAHITYVGNIPNYQGVPFHCYHEDIRNLCGWEILGNLGLSVGDIDAVIGGPPCPSFTMIGKRKIGDPRDFLVFEFARLAKEIQPKTFMMENVPGIVSKKLPDGRKVMDVLIEIIKENGWEEYNKLRSSRMR